MTPFKERMNLYRAYRELNPDKNYWDWKASVAEQDNDWGYQEWKRNLPENLRYESPDYDLYGAYKAGMQPALESDGTYHLGSRDPQTGRVLKRKGHPTYLMAIDAEKAAGYDVYEGDDGETYSKAPLPNQDISGWLEFKDYYNSNELGAKERQQLRSWYRRRKAYAERTENAELLEQLKDDGKTMRMLFGADDKMDSKLGPYYFNVNLDNIPINVVDLSVLGKNIGGIYHVRHSSNPKGSIDIPNNYRSTDLLHEYTHALNSEHGEPYDKTKTILTDRDLLLVYPIGDDSYWLDPREVHSRLMLLRHTHGISPLQKVTKDDLKKMRESGKSLHAILDYFADDDLILDLLNRVADAGKVQPSTNSIKTDILATQFGGVIPAMQGGGENKPLQDPRIKTITFSDGSAVQTVLPWANQQGLLNTPIADMFNPVNDVYDVVQVGKDAIEGNWAGVGAGLVLAAMPKWMEKAGNAVKSGVKKLINKTRNHDNVNWDEVVSGLAVPVKKDPTGVDAKPISDEIKVDDARVAGLSRETAPRYLDYGDIEFLDHIGYTRPQWLKDVQEFYDTDVAARERAMASHEGYFYHLPSYLQRSDLTFNTSRPVNVREYLDDIDFGGYANGEKIVMVRGTGMNPDEVLVHEGAHWDQSNAYHDLPFDVMHKASDLENTDRIITQFVSNKPVDRKYKESAQTLLDDAYTFTEDFLQKHPIYKTLEKGATNREMRYAIWKAAGKPNPDKLNEIIDNMSDDDVIYQLTQTNGYSKDWHKHILESGADRKTVADAIRKALKYVPAIAPVVGVASTIANENELAEKNGGIVPAMQNGGETTDLFIAQFGDAVTYGKDDTNLIGDIGNWWNDLTGMKNYGYGYCAITPNGKLTTQCAKYSNDILRDQGYKNITGDAWNRAAYSNMEPITSGYTGLKKPKKYTKDAAHEYLRNAANNFAENVDTTLLITNDVIGIYYPDSPNTQKAFEGGQWGETQTHTGHTIVGKDGTHYVVHNVDGHLKINKLADMLTGKYDYLPVSAYRPRK